MNRATVVTLLTVIFFGTLTVTCIAEQGGWPERPNRFEQEILPGEIGEVVHDAERIFNHEGWHGGIRDRISEANRRIDRGIERGSLTRHEARKLNDELNGILNKIDRMKADGHLDEREREKINRDLDRLDKDIDREKHDDDTGRRDDDSGRRDDEHRHR